MRSILEMTQKGDLDITGWLRWFLVCLDHAFTGAGAVHENVIGKARFREALDGEKLNDRQRGMLNRLVDGVEGKLTSQPTPSRAEAIVA